MTESGFCRRAGRPPAQHRRLSSASHARRVGTRERSSRYHGYLLRSPIRKNRPLRLSLLRVSAGISPFIFSASFFGRGAPLFSVPVSLHSWQGRAAFFGSRFLRWRRTAFLQYAEKLKSPPNFFSGLQWTMLIIMLYFITVSRRLNVLAREYPALTFVPHVS